MVAPMASATRCVARCRSAGDEDGTWNGSVGLDPEPVVRAARRMATGAMIAPVLAARLAGPAGSVVQEPSRRTGIPSGR